MLHRLKSRRAWLVASVVAATVIVATAAASTRSGTAATETLVLDKSFDLKTADPQRQFEVTGGIVAHVL
jgi:peptide/nickel transport system substrate-binding protein